MAAMLGDMQMHLRVSVEGRMLVDLKRNENVVARLDEQRRDADALQKLARGLRLVIMFGAAKSE